MSALQIEAKVSIVDGTYVAIMDSIHAVTQADNPRELAYNVIEAAQLATDRDDVEVTWELDGLVIHVAARTPSQPTITVSRIETP